MKRKQYALLLLALLLLPLAGSREPVRPGIRYVTQAHILFRQPEQEKQLLYREPAKISSVLTCLRLAAPYGQVKQADADPTGHQYQITLTYSDMTRQIYYLQDYRYFTRDGILWQKVKPDKAHLLYLLIQLLPSD